MAKTIKGKNITSLVSECLKHMKSRKVVTEAPGDDDSIEEDLESDEYST